MTKATELREKRYFDLLAYIASNAVAGEIMAINNYTHMVPLMMDTEEKIETVKQASDEAKHVRLLAKLGERLKFPVMQRIVEPQWQAVGRYVQGAALQNDLTSCLIAQDIMVETMAVVAYRTLGRNTDEETTRISGTILSDELHHLQIGIDRIKAALDKDADDVHRSLTRTHKQVMPQLFSMISYNCQSLCGDLGVQCDTLGLDSFKTDLDRVRVEALDTYMEMLDRVGFDTKVTTPLVGELGEYESRPWIEASSGSCCSVR
jgi:fatty aldehyde decarbonylase